MNGEYNEIELFDKNSFFEILSISDKERIHSSMIGWMLSNKCNVLTDDIKKGFFKSVLGIKTENFKIDKVINEYKNVDIYIKTDKFNVLIENKLKSTQHSNQLAKYNKTFNLIDKKNSHPFLLSLIEEEPEQSNWKTINGLIKTNIKKEATYRINFCREETKKAIPKLIKKLPEGVVLDEERVENLTRVFPLQYLSMFEQFNK